MSLSLALKEYLEVDERLTGYSVGVAAQSVTAGAAPQISVLVETGIEDTEATRVATGEVIIYAAEYALVESIAEDVYQIVNRARITGDKRIIEVRVTNSSTQLVTDRLFERTLFVEIHFERA